MAIEAGQAQVMDISQRLEQEQQHGTTEAAADGVPTSATTTPDDPDGKASSTVKSFFRNILKTLLKDDPLIKQRDALLVVASLIAAGAFQAALDPPSTITDHLEVKNPNINCKPSFNILKPFESFKDYGDVIRNCQAQRIKTFMSCNTTSFLSSVLLLFFFDRPAIASFLVQISILSMILTYNYVLVGISPNIASDLTLYFFCYITAVVIAARVLFRVMLPLSLRFIPYMVPADKAKRILDMINELRKQPEQGRDGNN